MKLFFITFMASTVVVAAKADLNSDKKMIATLQQYDNKYFASIIELDAQALLVPYPKNEELGSKRQKMSTAYFKAIEEAVQYLKVNSTWNLAIFAEIIRVSMLSIKDDPTLNIRGYLYPLYITDKEHKVFKENLEALKNKPGKGLEGFQEQDIDRIMKLEESIDIENKEGN